MEVMEQDNSVTRMLAQWRRGDEQALANATSLMYEELRRLAQRHLYRERNDHTIQCTALVHEAFVRLVDQKSCDWQSRSHFFALASRVMRRVLVDYARARAAAKRGGAVQVLSIEECAEAGSSDGDVAVTMDAELSSGVSHDDITAIDEALQRLESIDPRQARIVDMRYFGGLTVSQTAEALGISDATVKREWTLARAWLRRELAR